MKHLFKGVLVVAVASLILSPPAAALAAVFSSQAAVEVSEPIEDDAFLTGERVRVSEAIQDDVFMAGGILEVANTIGEDLFAAGNTISVSADVQDDAFLAGDTLTFEKGTVGDLFAAGRFIELGSDTRVTGDVYVAGAQVIINGAVEGDVRAASEMVQVGKGATIQGDLIVYGRTEPKVAEGATITGIVRNVTVANDDREGARSHIANWVRSVLTLFIVSLVVMYLLPRLSRAVVEGVPTTTLPSFLLGLVWLLLTIPVVILLFLSIVGWPLALSLGALTLFVFFLGLCLLPLVVGSFIYRRWITKAADTPLQWQQALLGAVVLVTLQWIPLIGPLLTAVLMFTMVGTLLRTFKNYI